MKNMDTNSISSQLLFCTVRVTGQKDNGEISVGTAFFFTFKADAGEIPVLITNKHVVEGCSRGTFLLHEASPDGTQSAGFFNVAMDNFTSLWVPHPAGLDLCALPIAPLLREAEQQQKSVFRKTLSENQIPDADKIGSLVALERRHHGRLPYRPMGFGEQSSPLAQGYYGHSSCS